MDAEHGKLEGDPLSTDDLLKNLPFLNEILTNKELSRSQLENFAKGAAALRHFRAGDTICEEGDFGSTAFYLVSGRVQVSIHNPLAQVRTRRAGTAFLKSGLSKLKKMTSFLSHDRDGQNKADDGESKAFIPIDAPIDLPRDRPLAELGAGELFGEMTCRTFQPRSATVLCMEDCVVVEMLRVVLDMLTGTREVSDEIKARSKVKAATFKGSPTFRKLVDDKYRDRTLNNHLRSVPMFAGLTDEFRDELRRAAELVSFGAGQPIVTEGEPADAFYLIRSGMVKVTQALPGGDAVRTYLSRGDYFGEIGLVQPDGKRTATCRALDQTDVVRIRRDLFETMLERSPTVRVQVKLVADARQRANAAHSRPTGMNMDEYLNQGLFEAQNLLLIDLNKCTRCDACVNACAEAHDGVTRLLRDGLRYDKFLVATACRSCHDPLCMTQCPVGSIRRKDSLEIVIESWCIGCSKCAELCPYGNINMHPFEVADEKPAAKPAAAAPAAPAANAAAKPTPAPVGAAVAAKPAPSAVAAGAANPAPPAKPTPAPAAAGPKPAADAVKPMPAEAPAVKTVEIAAKTGTEEPPPPPAPVVASEAATKPPAAPAKPAEPTPAAAASVPQAPPAAAAPASDPPPAAAVEEAKTPGVIAAKPAVTPPPASAAKPPAPAATPKATPAAAVKPAGAPAAAGAKPSAGASAPPATGGKPAAAAPAGAAAPAKKKGVKTVLKATTCDLCTDLLTPSCVYACPHDAAMRVVPGKYFAGQKSAENRHKRSWLSRLLFSGEPDNRTTH